MKRINHILLSLSLTVALSSCGNKENPEELTENPTTETSEFITVTQAQFEQARMQLGSLEEREFPFMVNATGLIDVPPEDRAVVNASMGGYIKTTPLLVGDKVRKGQLLVTIENPEFVTLQQNYMETYEQLAYLKMAFENQQSMKTENITSQKNFLKAESDYKSTLARYYGLEKQLQLINIAPASVRAGKLSSVVSIFAPISGSITAVHVTKGSYVSPATPILELVDNDHIHLELSVFEKDIMKVKNKQPIRFKIPEVATVTYDGYVRLVGTTLNANRTVTVHGHVKNEENHNLLIGMFVEAAIVVDNAFAKAIPQQALVQIDNVYYVLILANKKDNQLFFKQIQVSVKEEHDGFVTIESDVDFNEKTQFLTKGAFNLIGQ